VSDDDTVELEPVSGEVVSTPKPPTAVFPGTELRFDVA
jgi:hypothetical protein